MSKTFKATKTAKTKKVVTKVVEVSPQMAVMNERELSLYNLRQAHEDLHRSRGLSAATRRQYNAMVKAINQLDELIELADAPTDVTTHHMSGAPTFHFEVYCDVIVARAYFDLSISVDLNVTEEELLINPMRKNSWVKGDDVFTVDAEGITFKASELQKMLFIAQELQHIQTVGTMMRNALHEKMDALDSELTEAHNKNLELEKEIEDLISSLS